jgi:hypothetical protein
MALPNFLIAGAAKCGTTSLFHYLKQHPEVGMLESKEAHFFVDFRVKIKNVGEYEALFYPFRGKKAIGEAPVRALFDSEATLKIKEYLPDAKIILMLRNPAEMAHSLWGHMVRNGERLSFKKALKKEAERIADPTFRLRCNNWHADYYYFHRGLYYEQVKFYFDTFGRENVQVHLFDDFKVDPVEICRRIFSFLEVDPEYIPRIDRHNVGKVYRHRGLHKLLTQPPDWMQSFERNMPGFTGVRESLVKINTRSVPRLDAKLKEELLLKYRPNMEKLQELLETDLSRWLC